MSGGAGSGLAGLAQQAMVGLADSNPRPRAPKARALAKLRYSPYPAESSGWPGMFADDARSPGA